jgi:mRNA-degrading endonuclease RelE of RelBE toxin-antitoxin system
MQVQTTRLFDRDYAGLPAGIKGRTDKQLALLMTNPQHPSLRLKKVRGTDNIWEARISRGYRITLNIVGETIILRRIGIHDVLRRP